jgi:hypothetical protein
MLPFENVYFKYEEPNRMFWQILFGNWQNFSQKCHWPENYALSWQQWGDKGWELIEYLRIYILWNMVNPMPKMTLIPLPSWL